MQPPVTQWLGCVSSPTSTLLWKHQNSWDLWKFIQKKWYTVKHFPCLNSHSFNIYRGISSRPPKGDMCSRSKVSAVALSACAAKESWDGLNRPADEHREPNRGWKACRAEKGHDHPWFIIIHSIIHRTVGLHYSLLTSFLHCHFHPWSEFTKRDEKWMMINSSGITDESSSIPSPIHIKTTPIVWCHMWFHP